MVHSLCQLIEGYMVLVLDGKFFALETSSVCVNEVPSLKKDQHCVLLSAWHYTSRGMDNKTEGVYGGKFSFQLFL